MTLEYRTAGESHGPGVLTILEGMPAGFTLDIEGMNKDLARRQQGYGRGGRMKIEKDQVEVLAGVREGQSMGSPIAFMIKNKDHRVYKEEPLTRARPGHADLPGAMKFGFEDMRFVLERASARETAARSLAGSLCKHFLQEFSIQVVSWVTEIGGAGGEYSDLDAWEAFALAEKSKVRCPWEQGTTEMMETIDRAGREGDTLGGIFEVRVLNAPPGLGSYTSGHEKLDGRLAGALMSINGIKGVEVGLGFQCGRLPGSQIHDPIRVKNPPPEKGSRFYRGSNGAGGLEGGMTNGEEIIIRAAMKPIATLSKPLPSVDIISKEELKAGYERSDTCAVPAASIVGELTVAFVLAQALLEKFGGDHINDTKKAYEAYLNRLTKDF